MSASPALAGGFGDPARDAAVAFRGLLDAMSRPGSIGTCLGADPPAPMSVACGTALLVLCDADTPLYLAGELNSPDIQHWVAFHTGAPRVGPEHCRFAAGTWDALQPVDRYAIGTEEYPDRSATLIVECPSLAASGARLTGPGIHTEAHLSLPERSVFQSNAQLFPLGLDFILTAGAQVASLPRTTRVD